jgi:3-dehydroquinate synthase
VSIFSTLPKREFHAGLAEIIKTAILGDAELFHILEHSSFEELYSNTDLLEAIIMHCVRIKAAIVAEDEREGGRRRILNLGHTIAHAIEKSSNKMNHGEAVAVGLYHITRSALAQNIISQDNADRILSLIDKYDFDTELPIERKLLLKAIEGDKKRNGDSLHLIFPTAIGAVDDRIVLFEDLEQII